MIKIDETHFITADPYCFILQEKKTVQDGKTKGEEYFENIGYYTSIESALKGLLKKETRKFLAKQDIVSLKETIKEIKKIEEEITKVSKGF